MTETSFGLKKGDMEILHSVFSEFKTLKKVVLYGSRAKGNFKNGSDVDLAVWFSGDEQTGKLNGKLNDETLLPYHFDVLNFDSITNKDLTEHIQRVGIIIFEK